MSDYGRRIVLDTDFQTAVRSTSRAIRNAGLQIVARVDVRGVFWEHVPSTFKPYLLLEAWSPDLALDAIQHDPDVGAVFATSFAVYEQPDGRIAVVASQPLSPVAEEGGWRHEAPSLAGIADRESCRVGEVLGRLQHEFAGQTATTASTAA